MDILKLINDQISNQGALSKLGESVGAKPSQVQQLAQLGMPALLQALGRNASTSEGALALDNALAEHQDDNVDDVEGFISHANTDDGRKMLQHIFAGKNDRVQNNLAKQTGLDPSQVSGLMAQLAPLLLGTLGNVKKRQNLDSSGVAGLLGGLLQQGGNDGLMGRVTNLLDSDNDGNVVDEGVGLRKGFLKK